MIKKITFLILLAFLLNACDKNNIKAPNPKTKAEREEEKFGRITGEGIILYGGKKKYENIGITVNSYLWRASLDVINFMPLKMVDPFGGVIITEWYEDPNVPNVKYKFNIIINSAYLRADAIKISAFKQEFKNGKWKNITPDVNFINKIEEKILSRARILKSANKG